MPLIAKTPRRTKRPQFEHVTLRDLEAGLRRTCRPTYIELAAAGVDEAPIVTPLSARALWLGLSVLAAVAGSVGVVTCIK